MAGEVRRQAVLLDAMGTLLRFEDPAPRLRAALRERLGVDVGAEAAAAAIRAEIAFYRAHLHEGRDAASLADAAGALRGGDAAALLGAGRARAAGGADRGAARRARVHRLSRRRARAARAAGGGLRARRRLQLGRLAARAARARPGLAPLVDGAVASAEVGAAKPERAIFARGLALAGARAADAWHVGDSVAADVEGALAAGIRPGADRPRRRTRAASCSRAGASPTLVVLPDLSGLPRRRPYAARPACRAPRPRPPTARPAAVAARAAGGRLAPGAAAAARGRDALPRWPLWAPFAGDARDALIVAVVGVGVIALVVELAGVDTTGDDRRRASRSAAPTCRTSR